MYESNYVVVKHFVVIEFALLEQDLVEFLGGQLGGLRL
jgi:hypothetical protein